MVVRVKDRFKHPSGGGWRDVMINYVVVIDGAKHVCEVQLVHKSLLTARKGLPGHIIYGVVRNATEVLEFLGLLIKFEREAGLRALVSAGWGREAIERLGLPPPVLALEGHSEGHRVVGLRHAEPPARGHGVDRQDGARVAPGRRLARAMGSLIQ